MAPVQDLKGNESWEAGRAGGCAVRQGEGLDLQVAITHHTAQTEILVRETEGSRINSCYLISNFLILRERDRERKSDSL